MHFIRGNCSKSDCRYAHVRVNAGAEICRAFSELGYCSKGTSCEQRHVFECPDYAENGVCHDRKCRLPHVDRAGRLRMQAGGDTSHNENSGDIKPDDPMEVEPDSPPADADDVSSDDLDDEHVLGARDTRSPDLSAQRDFIHF